MRRSKYGYLLLALLVITGLAGTITSTSITSKERKFAASHLKDTKGGDVLKSIKGLSRAQLDFKTAPGKWSIKECVCHIAVSERILWQTLENAMNQPANPEKRSEIKLTDEQIVHIVQNRSKKIKFSEKLDPKITAHNNLDEAIDNFKSLRAEHIKYMKTTTEDLRNHVTQLPMGWVDCYQLCLFVSVLSNLYMQQIEDIKADPNFPSR
jgi:hypothetical protein